MDQIDSPDQVFAFNVIAKQLSFLVESGVAVEEAIARAVPSYLMPRHICPQCRTRWKVKSSRPNSDGHYERTMLCECYPRPVEIVAKEFIHQRRKRRRR